MSDEKKPSPIFLYTKECELSASVLRLLKNAGYIPVEVLAIDAVKILQPLPIQDGTPIFKSAMNVIAKADYSSVPEKFGRCLATELSK